MHEDEFAKDITKSLKINAKSSNFKRNFWMFQRKNFFFLKLLLIKNTIQFKYVFPFAINIKILSTFNTLYIIFVKLI